MKSITLTFIFFIVSHTYLIAQNLYKGIVADSLTGNPIEFVDVYHKNYQTYTNADGIFSLPGLTDTIKLSHLAYKKRKISISDFNADTIFLVNQLVTLNEVTVFQERIKLGEYIKIGRNYPFDPFTEKFFLRTVLKKNDEILKMQDLVGLISRKQLLATGSRPMPKNNLRFTATQMRKAGKKEDELYFEMWGIEKINSVLTSIAMSPEFYNFHEDISKDSSHIKLAFKANDAHSNKSSKGHYVIKKADNAILEFNLMEGLGAGVFEERAGVRYRTSSIEIKVYFKKRDDKYYLDKGKINAQVELFIEDQEGPTIYDAEYIWITQDIVSDKTFKKMSPYKDIFKLDKEYEKSFWDNQAILSFTSEMKKFIEKTEAFSEKKEYWTNLK